MAGVQPAGQSILPPEMKEKWNRIVRTTPSRVVSAIEAYRPGMKTKFGDGHKDIVPVLAFLVAVASDTDRNSWRRLLDLDVVEKLCQCVIYVEPVTSSVPWTTLHMMTHPLYFVPFLSLISAVSYFGDPLSQSDIAVISTIKKNWSQMIGRLWRDRMMGDYSYGGLSENHSRVSTLATELLRVDPSFHRILSEPADLTIPLVTRYLMETVQTTDPLDLDAHMKFLRTIKYLESNSSSARVLLQGVLKGSDGSFKKLITKFASLIPTSEDTLAPIHLLHGFLDHAGQKDAIDRDFIIAIIRHSPLITNIFDVLRRLGKPRVADSLSQDSDFLVYEQVFQFLYKCVSLAYLYCREECPRLVVLWVRTDLFGALDQCLPRLISRPFVAMPVTVLFASLRHTILNHPSLLRVLRYHLPRPRTLRACLDLDYTTNYGQDFLNRGPLLSRSGVAGNDEYTEHAWTHILGIQYMCQMNKQCMRRSCTKKATARCKGCQTKYCGHDCQKQDWKEHRLVCGFENDLDNIELIDGCPTKLPWRFPRPPPALFQGGSAPGPGR